MGLERSTAMPRNPLFIQVDESTDVAKATWSKAGGPTRRLDGG